MQRRYLSAESMALVLTPEPADVDATVEAEEVARLAADPIPTARPRSSSFPLALRARLHENQRANPNPEVIQLPAA